MKKLIIAEKPDVMRKFVKVLEPKAKSVNVAPYVYYYEGTKYIFASACGHLFKTKEPQEISSLNEKWQATRLDLPNELPIKVISSSKNYFKCIKDLNNRKDIDEIIICTDPDREGQLIWELISKNLKIKVPVSRVWIKEWTDSQLKKAFDDRKPNKSYHNLAQAGLARQYADYAIGMTGTRVSTVCFGGYKDVINEGRVQSATRHLVGELENTIKHFKPEDYSVIELQTSSDETGKILTLESERIEPEISKDLIALLPSYKYTMMVVNKNEKKGCPLLYTTNDILVEASSKLSLSSEETTKILQSLYQDYALTTYPRTEINQISKSSAKDVMKIVNSLDGAGLIDDIIKEIKTCKYSFQKHLINNGGEDMPHEAITPTYDGNPKKILSQLSKNELAVYTLIVKRFLQGFYPPAEIAKTDISTSVEYKGQEYKFKTSGKTIIKANWLKISGIPKDVILPKITDKKAYKHIDSNNKLKKTQPPARFSEATLLEAMKNAGRYVEDKDAKKILKEVKGIGTGATRNEILKGLYKSGFLVKKGKTIYPTEKCMEWMETTPMSPLKSPIMTANLESDLALVEEGKLSYNQFIDKVNHQIDEIIDKSIKAPKKTISSSKTSSTAKKSSSSSDLGVCPFCGREMRESEKSYYCPGYKEGCQFTIWKIISGKKISKTTAKTLIKKGYTGKLKGFVSKTGKNYEAKLILNKTTKKIELSFK